MLKETAQAEGIIELMKTSGALLSGHFQLASGLHSETYIQCALLLEDPGRAERVGSRLFHLLGKQVGPLGRCVVASPALGGIIIGHEVARASGSRFVFTERVDGRMTLRRGFKIDRGEKVVVVEDVITTGGSTREVIEVVEERGGRLIGVGSIVNRGAGTDFSVPFAYLVGAEIVNFAPQECPLCQRGMPVVKPGSRR